MTLKMNHMIVVFLVYIRPLRDICDEFFGSILLLVHATCLSGNINYLPICE